MGCDIHAYIEHSEKPSKKEKRYWFGFGGKINPGRHYGIFAKLVGVRNYEKYGITPLSEPKGLPEELSYEAKDDNNLYISDDTTENERYCSREDAERWVMSGKSKIIDEHWVTNPDWHSHSFVNADELEKVFNDPKTQFNGEGETEYMVMLECLRCFERLGHEARLVFWFDN